MKKIVLLVVFTISLFACGSSCDEGSLYNTGGIEVIYLDDVASDDVATKAAKENDSETDVLQEDMYISSLIAEGLSSEFDTSVPEDEDIIEDSAVLQTPSSTPESTGTPTPSSTPEVTTPIPTTPTKTPTPVPPTSTPPVVTPTPSTPVPTTPPVTSPPSMPAPAPSTPTPTPAPSWGAWSSWSTTSVSSSNTRQVESKTQYSYRDTTVTVTWGAWSDWSTSRYSSSSTRNVETKQQAQTYTRYREWDASGTLIKDTSTDTSDWFDVPDGACVFGFVITGTTDGNRWENNGTYRTRTLYRYQDSTTTASTGAWSDWSDTYVAASTTREVRQQTVYRYRDLG